MKAQREKHTFNSDIKKPNPCIADFHTEFPKKIPINYTTMSQNLTPIYSLNHDSIELRNRWMKHATPLREASKRS